MSFSANAPRLRFGHLWVDAVSFDQAVACLERLVDEGLGGAVYTPNVDHVVIAERSEAFQKAYSRVDLSLADGQLLVWCSPLLGLALPAKVSGSDLFLPAMQLAGRRGYGVYLLGSLPEVCAAASERLRREEGVEVVGTDSPFIGLAPRPDEDAVVERLAASKPALVLVCLGAPKAELFIERVRERLPGAVFLAIGASLDFYVGRVRRAPPWMQRTGVEWLFRLLQEPRRLWRRYLLDDPRFLAVLLRTRLAPRAARVREVAPAAAAAPPHSLGAA